MQAVMESGVRKKPVRNVIEVERDHFVMIANIEGCWMLRSHNRQCTRVLTDRNIAVIGGGAKIEALTARGNHRHIIFSWPKDRNRALAQWWETFAPHGECTIGFSQCQTGSLHGLAFDRVSRWDQTTGDMKIASMKACVYLLVSESLAHDQHHLLSLTANNHLEKPIGRLVSLVRENPCSQWTLREAAQIVGYSAFHLSRTFKTTVGYGFPEFVDRCRTELAIQTISDPALTMESVATQAGFGSTQAMRNSFRAHTGFLPSEVRSFLIDQHAIVNMGELDLELEQS
jgi:AraC-like DNA-binding protein